MAHQRALNACSVRFYLLREEEQMRIYGRAKHSVQLRDRHWILRNGAGGVHNTVTGAGVIGEYPILTPGTTAACLSIHFLLHGLSPCHQNDREKRNRDWRCAKAWQRSPNCELLSGLKGHCKAASFALSTKDSEIESFQVECKSAPVLLA